MTIVWLLFRIIILNVIILTMSLIIGTTRGIIEQVDPFMILLPFQLYMTTFFLANLVYLIGIVFEAIYLRMWNKKIVVKEFEKKFFKVGLLMTIIVHSTGVVLYLLNYLE